MCGILPWSTVNFGKYFGKKIRFHDGTEGHIFDMFYLSGGVVGVKIIEDQSRIYQTFLYEEDFLKCLLDPIDPTLCEHCGERKSVNTHDCPFVIGIVYERESLCEQCYIEIQLKSAKDVASKIPYLEEALEKITKR